MTGKIKVAVIGVGEWGENYVRILKQLECLTVICDNNDALLKSIKTKYDVDSYLSIDEMLAAKRVEACIVATPTDTHYPIAKKILQKGIPLLVEKPLARTYLECKDLISLAEKTNTFLGTSYVDHFNPIISKAKDLIMKKIYGELLFVVLNRESKSDYLIKDKNIFSEVSVHDIEIALNFFNEMPIMVFARTGRGLREFPDFATIIMEFSGGKMGIITSNRITPKKIRTFNAVCSKAIISGNIAKQEILIEGEEVTSIPRLVKKEPLELEIQNFIDSLEGRKTYEINSRYASKITLIAEKADFSAKECVPIIIS